MAVLTCLFCLAAHAEEDKKIWECRTSNPGAEPILYLVEWGSRSYVKFAHRRFASLYQSDAGQRGWYWYNDGSGFYRYGVVLGADGKAWYHAFTPGTEESKPLDYFLCKEDR